MMVSIPYQEQRRVMVMTEARQAEDGSPHRMVIAANERSRNGDELNLRGISFKNYRKNPVVLWAHDAYEGIPIAKTLKIGHDDQGRIETDFEFNSGDEFAARVENAWNGGFIRAASIRYMPTKVVEVRNEDGEVERLRIEESELLEWSLVPVPADPDSVRAAARALNLPEEIFRGIEPEPEDDEAEPPTDPATDEPEPGPKPKEADPFIDALRERMVALEEELRELAAKTSTTEEEPPDAPVPDEPEDPMLAAIGAQFAAMRQIMEEK
jgi:HK97 family phage prohead protease